jgi:hypothetical protein
MAFYFAKTSAIVKRMGGQGFLRIIISRNGCRRLQFISKKRKSILQETVEEQI